MTTSFQGFLFTLNKSVFKDYKYKVKRYQKHFQHSSHP